MALTEGTMLKKFHVALFLGDGTDWKQIKKSTDNTITMNAETKVFDYIVDESPTTVVDKYAPSLSQPITMYKGEADYELVYSKFFAQATGNDAKSKILIVFYAADDGGAFDAWLSDCVLIIDNMNPVESTITVNINFAGTTEKGKATIVNGSPVFVGNSTVQKVVTFTVDKSGPISDATVIINGTSKLTGADGKVSFTLIEGKEYLVSAYKDSEGSVVEEYTVGSPWTKALTLLS